MLAYFEFSSFLLLSENGYLTPSPRFFVRVSILLEKININFIEVN